MDATDRLRLARLEAELAALRKKVAAVGGVGVSTAAGGATHVRTTQLGFAAELTSGWSATTGYSFKRRKLDTTASPITLVNPGVQPTGDRAYEVGGNTGLTAGAPVWLEPSPDGAGYLFTAGTSADGPPVPPPTGANCSQPAGWGRLTCLTAVLGPGYGWCSNVAAGGSVRMVSADGLTWGSDGTTLDIGGTNWTVAYDWPDGGVPRLVLTNTGSGGAAYTMKYLGCSAGVLVFGGAAAFFCTEPPGTEECDNQLFTISVYCIPCLFDCVDTDADGNGVCLPAVAGAYSDGAACLAACSAGTGCNVEALLGVASTMVVPADVTYFASTAQEFTVPAGVYAGTVWADYDSTGVRLASDYTFGSRTLRVQCFNTGTMNAVVTDATNPGSYYGTAVATGAIVDQGPPVVMQFPSGTLTPDFTVTT